MPSTPIGAPENISMMIGLSLGVNVGEGLPAGNLFIQQDGSFFVQQDGVSTFETN